VENNVAACPHCGATQVDDGPRATPTPDQPPPGLLRRFIVGAVKFDDPFLSLLFFAIPVLIGGGVGYWIGETSGAMLGLLVAFLVMLLLTVVMAAGDGGG
jgi:hypothetical protein